MRRAFFRSATVDISVADVAGFVLILQYFCFSFFWYFYVTWLPTYLREAASNPKTLITNGWALPVAPSANQRQSYKLLNGADATCARRGDGYENRFKG